MNEQLIENYKILEKLSEGEMLDKVLKRRGKLSCKEAVPIFVQLLDGIEYAHKAGIIHGNINPATIMLADEGTVKILGFGTTNHLGAADIPQVEKFTKKQDYLSPEQIKGQEADARSDIYALGTVFYEILTGKTPFNAENKSEPEEEQIGEMDAARLYEILTGKTLFSDENKVELKEKRIKEIPPSPRTFNPDIPEKIEAAIIKALAQNPGERFQTASEFLEALVEAGIDVSVIREKSAMQPSPSGQPSIGKEAFRESKTGSSKIPSKSISNFADKIKEKRINRNQISVGGIVKSDVGASFLSKSVQRNLTIAGTTIFAVIIIFFISQFIFFRSENHQTENHQSDNHQSEQIPAKVENEQSGDVKIEYEAEKSDVETMLVSPVSPIVKREPAAAPSPKVIKKKELRKSKTERLRHAERILTGV